MKNCKINNIMASIKDLKKDINYIFGEVIDEVNYKQLLKPDVDNDKAETIIEEAVATYEDFYKKIHDGRKAKDKKAYFKKLDEELNQSVKSLLDKIEAL